ncbi:MAG: putative toxin-antitoxin system toxin component, PIN family [Pirellulales bacterium]
MCSRRRAFGVFGALVRVAEIVEITQSIRECRDPRDDKYLELAVCGDAKYIVSGDLDLLTMSPYGNIAIVTPANFLQRVSED